MNTKAEPLLDLAASFDNLKRTARTLGEFERWLNAHPECFPGMENISTESLVIGINVDFNGLIYDLREESSIIIGVNVASTVTTKPVDFIEKLKWEPTTEDTVVVRQTHELELYLTDWPLATALAAALFFNGGYYGVMAGWGGEVAPKIDAALQKHFPCFTLEMIGSLQNTDLLTLDADGMPQIDSIIHMLFDSRDAALRASTPTSIPEDLTP